MTELSHSPDDEIVSAVLDGEATAAEQARVDADPELRRRMAEMARVRDQVAATVTPLDELTMRRLVDQASAQFDGADGAARPLGRPAPLRADPPWWRRGVGIGLGSAAALVVLALLVGPALLDGLSSGGDDSADVAATSAGDAPNTVAESFDASADEGAEEDSGGDDADGGAGSAAEVAPDPTDRAESEQGFALGPEHDSVDAFAASMRTRATGQPYGGGESSEVPPTTTTVLDRQMIEPLDELFAQCGTDALDDHQTSSSTIVAQAQGLIDDVRMLGFAIDHVDDLIVVVVIAETCEVVAVR